MFGAQSDCHRGSERNKYRGMNKETKHKRVTQKEFDRIMRMIREQTREYPQEALEDIFLYLDSIEKRYGVGDSALDGE